MTRALKLAFHLEMVIWEDLPEGLRQTAAEIEARMAKATEAQKTRAYHRALTHAPVLWPEEQTGSFFPIDKPAAT